MERCNDRKSKTPRVIYNVNNHIINRLTTYFATLFASSKKRNFLSYYDKKSTKLPLLLEGL